MTAQLNASATRNAWSIASAVRRHVASAQRRADAWPGRQREEDRRAPLNIPPTDGERRELFPNRLQKTQGIPYEANIHENSPWTLV